MLADLFSFGIGQSRPQAEIPGRQETGGLGLTWSELTGGPERLLPKGGFGQHPGIPIAGQIQIGGPADDGGTPHS